MLRRLIALAALSGVASLAQAAGMNDGRPAHLHSGFTLGVGMGLNQITVEDSTGFEFFDERATAWQVFAGYRLNRFIAAEIGWIDGGSVGDSFGGIEYRAKPKAAQASVLGMLPIGERVQLFARASAFRYKLKERLQDATERVIAESEGNEFGYGAGAAYLFDGALVRLEYQQVDFDEGFETQLLSLSVAWNF